MPVKMAGGKPRAPAVFGSYEVGRSRKQSNQHPNANFTSGSKKGLTVEEQGDPGSYDPYTHTDLVASSSFSHNKSHKPFGSTSGRKFGMNLYGADAPGPGAYDPEKPHPSTNPNNSIFRSGSSQRPNNKTRVPGAGTYSPNHKSVHANMRNAGASMRGTGDRFAEEPTSTEESIGPGAYEQETGTLSMDAQKSVDKGSKLKPAFGATSDQRALPFLAQDNPGPGAYQPLSLRHSKRRSPSPSRKGTPKGK